MFAKNHMVSFLGVDDLDAAREFYTDVLGLTQRSEDHYTLVFEAGGRTLRISRVQDFQPQAFSVLGWEVDDIEARVKSLMQQNVSFNNYEEMMGIQQDELQIWQADGARIAWFNDPAGNLLSLTEIT